MTNKKKSADSEWVGLGIFWLWGLPEDHRLHIAGVTHDATQDAMAIFVGKKTLNECSTKPIYYREFVTTKLRELQEYASANRHKMSMGQVLRSWSALKDVEFYEICTKLRETTFQKIEGEIFYKQVKIWSYFKYRGNYANKIARTFFN